MSAVLQQIDRVFHPAIAGLLALVGAGIGGGIYISLSGAVLGLLIALGLCGLTGTVLALLARLGGVTAETASPSIVNALAAAPAGLSSRTEGTMVESTLPPGAPIEAVKIEATENEAAMLAAGRFSEYHLAKAKRYFEAKNFKEAAYQAAASLAHGDIPEARTIRKTALAAAKGT